MKIQYLNGGLANQVFQYIFYRFLELNSDAPDEICFLDDSYFYFNDIHNGYELEKIFPIKPHLLSRNFTPDVWEEFIINRKNGISIPQIFKNLGFPIAMVAESINYKTVNAFDGLIYDAPTGEFHPEVAKIRMPNLYYHGYWIHADWYRSCQEILSKELVFPSITDKINLNYANNITSAWSVAVHIRRGDYVNLNWAIDTSYYYNAVKAFTQEYPDAYYFIFSDDIRWCQENAVSLGLNIPSGSHVIYVEGNMDGKNYIDLQLMSMCKGMILSNSAFSFLAALLDVNLEKIVSADSKRTAPLLQ